MQKEQREQISSLMDGEFVDGYFVKAVSEDENLQACWHRYHIARDVMQGKLHSCSLTLDISNAVAKSIENEALYGELLVDQPNISEVIIPKAESLFWIRAKEVIARVSQVGLAACVTLAIIAGVQYHQGQSSDQNMPILNTVPVGVNVAPVGGIQKQDEQQLLEKREYDKIRLLVQDYELQKRLNAR